VIVVYPDEQGIVFSTGYSRELAGNTHAEANALEKARTLLTLPGRSETSTSSSTLLHTASVYTTLEPCSVRTSGLAPCANALIDAGVKEVIIGVKEPDDFVTCEGVKVLRDGGVEVKWVKGLEEECLRVARGDFD
jgi:pyrimidine deaminase RibD-like protein